MKTILVLTAALFTGLVGGMAGTLVVIHHDKSNSIPETVRAYRFELIDRAGQIVSQWGIDQHENPLLAFTPSGVRKEERRSVGLSGQELSLDDRESQRVAFGLTGNGDPFFMFRGHDEKPRASLYVDSDGKTTSSCMTIGLGVQAWEYGRAIPQVQRTMIGALISIRGEQE